VILVKPFFVCVDGVLVREGQILPLKRSVEPFKGYWHVVGGHVEENETLKEGLKREFKEETNLDREVGGIIDGRIEETFDRTKLIVVFDVVDAKGEVKLNGESEKYGWFGQIPPNHFMTILNT
jgi:8-oxo-dGTP diphosphatase